MAKAKKAEGKIVSAVMVSANVTGNPALGEKVQYAMRQAAADAIASGIPGDDPRVTEAMEAARVKVMQGR